MSEIRYSTTAKLTPAQFVDLLERSTLGARRPVDDAACIAGMLEGADLLATAWSGNLPIGVARSVTDFSFCCYLSDLAVDEAFQQRGIGKNLITLTQKKLGPRCKLILLAAPAAAEYYPHIGFTHQPRCWLLEPDQILKKSS